MSKLLQAIAANGLSIFLITCTPAIAQGVVVQGPENGPPACGQWLSNQEGSPERDWYKSWLMGFLSGMAMESRKDILKGTPASSLFFWMDKYCRENPLNSAVQGAISLNLELKKQKGIK